MNFDSDIFRYILPNSGHRASNKEAALATTRRAAAKMITKDLILWLDLKIMNTEARSHGPLLCQF